MRTTDYPSDLTDAQFARLAPLLPRPKPGGRPRSVNLHDVVNGILYVSRTGCQWRALPRDYPPRAPRLDLLPQRENDRPRPRGDPAPPDQHPPPPARQPSAHTAG